MSVQMSCAFDKEDIKKTLGKYNSWVPDSYIDFLSQSNGMFINGDSYCVIPFSKVDSKEISVQEIYGVRARNIEFDLDNNNRFRDDIMAFQNPLIIAGDPGGNFFLFSGNQDDDAVYYWDRAHIHFEHCYDYPEGNEEGNIYKLSNSFNGFYKLIMRNVGGDISIVTQCL